MPPFASRVLFWCGIVAVVGAALHIAILVGGADWYAFFGAPRRLVEMARVGNPRAAISCLVIAAILLTLACYAFSGAGVLRRLPFLRSALTLIAAALLLRGVLFVPLIVWRPGVLAGVCDCQRVDTFIIVTSLICLGTGIGFAIGARHALQSVPSPATKSR